MINVIDRLIQDHVNITKMHRVLKTEISFYDDEKESPNVSIILDTLEYIKNYPELFHHPLEDRIYRIMRLKIDDLALIQVLDKIELQHAEMQVLSNRLMNDFVSIVNGQVVPIGRLKEDFKKYIELSEEHIACENSYLFPAITRYVSGDDIAVIYRDLDASKDPVFDGQCLAVYQNLHDYILEYEHECA